jgi:hypothetical protein
MFEKILSKLRSLVFNSPHFADLLAAHLQEIKSGRIKCVSINSRTIFKENKLTRRAEMLNDRLRAQLMAQAETIKNAHKRTAERAKIASKQGAPWLLKVETTKIAVDFMNQYFGEYCKRNNVAYIYDTGVDHTPFAHVIAKYTRFSNTPNGKFNDRVVLHVKQTNPKDATRQMLAEIDALDLSNQLAAIDKAAASFNPK